MGKKRHGKDRAYLTATEWREEHGGYKGEKRGRTRGRLPFHCCAISFLPFEDPVCTADGTVFDIVNAVPYIQKFKRHPVTGEPLELKDLIRLHFHKNGENEYWCPVLNKVFTEHTHIVAIRPSGNVYCWDAVDQLCLKPKNMRDLLTDEPFTRKDIIHLQDPLNLSGKRMEEFDHVKKELAVEDDEERVAREADPLFGIKVASEDTQRILGALNTKEAEAAMAAGGGGRKAQAERLLAEAKAKAAAKAAPACAAKQQQQQAAAAPPAAGPDPRLRSAPRQDMQADASAGRRAPPPYSIKLRESFRTTGAASRSFTSTAMNVVTRNERQTELIELKPQKKGYVRLHTSLGDLNIELHCDLAPKTCENFMALAEGGYYDGTVFHRSIRNFMIQAGGKHGAPMRPAQAQCSKSQGEGCRRAAPDRGAPPPPPCAQGGDPTGTGKGGVSVFGPTFRDELDSRLLHSGRGVLSMANSGKDTNGSQARGGVLVCFFILYKSAHHLDYKHSVFGRVVGGFEVLTAMEKEIAITGATVFVNPYKELIEEKEKKEAERIKAAQKEEQGYAEGDEFGRWFSNPAAAASAPAAGGGVGRYIPAAGGAAAGGGGEAAAPAAKRQKGGGGGYAPTLRSCGALPHMTSLLRSHPLLRAATTSGMLLATGDVLCQLARAAEAGQPAALDLAATARMAGARRCREQAIDALGHRRLARVASSLARTALKTAVGQLTLTPCYVVAFFTYMGLLEGLPLVAAVGKARAAAPAAIRHGVAYWACAHLVSFRFVPPSARLPYLGATGILWNSYLSFANAAAPTAAGAAQEQQRQPDVAAAASAALKTDLN
eukprot:scaffold12.g8218.t1